MMSDPNRLINAQQYAYAYLRGKIFSGDLVGGMKLNPMEIAASLGISRMPVREALRQLDAEGFVVIRPNRGAVVTQLTIPEIEDLFEMRAVLESLAVRYAMPNLTPDAIEELDLLRGRMDRVRGESQKWLRLHAEFHEFISDLAQRARLASEISRL